SAEGLIVNYVGLVAKDAVENRIIAGARFASDPIAARPPDKICCSRPIRVDRKSESWRQQESHGEGKKQRCASTEKGGAILRWLKEKHRRSAIAASMPLRG